MVAGDGTGAPPLDLELRWLAGRYIFLTSCWFSLQKLVMNTTVTYFLGITNMGVPYYDCYTGVSTPIYTRCIGSLQKVSLFILVIR